MSQNLLHASHIRKHSQVKDSNGCLYMPVSAAQVTQLGLAPGHNWWWCVLPLRRHRSQTTRSIPYPGQVVYIFTVQRIVLGFIRGRTVGIVELR